ncbi:protein SRG1-like [Gossypium australe]|uniref:Protein SRG1-like n=1 Tax=Gossypium australe TaxID=47621 RepID=A0A5B6W6Y4_9ROSI|nr:protein SRG1-like [Gossypium australe]
MCCVSGYWPWDFQFVHGVAKQFFGLPQEEKLKNSRAANEVEGYGHDLIVSERQVLDWNTRLFLRVCPENKRNLNLWPENPHNFRYNNLHLKAQKEFWGQNLDILHAYSPKVKQMMDLLFKAMAKSLDLEKNSSSDEEVEGLQIVKDGAWITVPLIPRALVVNLGDQMQIMSNRIFKSPVHKAVTNTDKPRLSVVMSNEAEVDKEIGPVEALIGD